MSRKKTNETLTPQEAAAFLHIPIERVRRLAQSGKLPGRKLGKDWGFLLGDLQSWSKPAPRKKTRAPLPEGKVSPKTVPEKAESSEPIAKTASAVTASAVTANAEAATAEAATAEAATAEAASANAASANAATPTAKRNRLPFPVVGIGASAGGLEALEEFLKGTPADSGLALVVVQHLDPTHRGMLVELLQRTTPMAVIQIKDRIKVEANRVYVIPPNKELTIQSGVLRLHPPKAPRGLRLPINSFFQSLAEDQGNQSIGVILSGMGSDGTLGLRAIKEHGGAAFVQEPASAKFDAMPRSAIDADIADGVAPPPELPNRIIAHRGHIPSADSSDPVIHPKTQSAIEAICVILRKQTGHDFSQYKRSTVYRRIERRLGLHGIDGISGYVGYLEQNPQETLLLFKELLIGVTSFFRDPEAWDHLRKKSIPALLTERAAGGVLRAWVPGCSTGEEAYSLAMVIKEVLGQHLASRGCSIQIFATDLDKDSIERARQGVYPSSITADVSVERLRRFFVKDGSGFRISQEIRETVIFATQNVFLDPPFTKLEIVSCRNLLIYLMPELQRKLIPLFHYSLNPRGILFLGSAETVGTNTDLFAPMAGKSRIYRRLEPTVRSEQVEFPAARHLPPSSTPAPAIPKRAAANLQTLADQILLERYCPAAVLTNEQGDILYIGGRTGKYLEPAAGKANWNIHAMARDGIGIELSRAFQKAVRTQRLLAPTRATLENAGTVQLIDICVNPLQEPEALRGMLLIVFSDVTQPTPIKRPGGRATSTAPNTRLDLELRRSREELRTTREEMQASQEELRSANEELQSTNEELQSTNEELTTSKEEMQSLNEELQTLNHELQTKLDELSRANDDMKNLLDSTDIATLFLDALLHVRRFTAQMTKIINLIPGDVNRPITDLASDLVYPELAADADSVLKTLAFKERPVRTVDGRWFSVRVMPYRTVDNRIDGVVITFLDISVAKTLEAKLREERVEKPVDL